MRVAGEHGIDGYASGAVAGVLTRRYQGVLIAALRPPVRCTLLRARPGEMVHHRDCTDPVFADRWSDWPVQPGGSHRQKRFHL